MSRFSRFLPCLALLLSLPLSGCLNTGPDVVCVDVERVLSQSKAAQQANEHLGKVQTILQNGLAAYQEELKKSPEEKRQQELQQGLAVLQRQMALEQAAAREVVSKHMLDQIEAWRAEKGDVAVIARQNLLAAPAAMDITAEIISRMDAGSVSFAALPKISIRTQADKPEEAAPAEKAPAGKKTEKK
ncbi:OmpH family outer membrane protein [Desulfovibrio sp.]